MRLGYVRNLARQKHDNFAEAVGDITLRIDPREEYRI